MLLADKYYIEHLSKILDNGCLDENPRPKYKDGTPAYTKFITQVFEIYDISKGELPITTLRNTSIKTGIKEILWIYQKQSNSLDVAHELGIHWWDNWDIGNGTIGDRYGYTVNKYNLINELLTGLKENPFGRSHIINLFQYENLKSSKGLFPCAYETMWSVRKINGEMYLDLTLNQRSNDYIMAGYINKVQYVALQMMIAGHLGYKCGTFAHYVHNLHIYDRHYDAAKELMERSKNINEKLNPKFYLKTNKNFYDYTINDFEFIDIDKIKPLENKLEIAI